MAGSPAAANMELDRRPRAREASPPHLAVRQVDGDRHLKTGDSVPNRDCVATAAASAGVADQRHAPTGQPVQPRAEQPPDERVDAVQDRKAHAGHPPNRPETPSHWAALRTAPLVVRPYIPLGADPRRASTRGIRIALDPDDQLSPAPGRGCRRPARRLPGERCGRLRAMASRPPHASTCAQPAGANRRALSKPSLDVGQDGVDKNHRGRDSVRVWGLDRVRLADLTILAKLPTALARRRAVPLAPTG